MARRRFGRKARRARAAPRGGRRYGRRSKNKIPIGAGIGTAMYVLNNYQSYVGYTDKKKYVTDMVPLVYLTGFNKEGEFRWSYFEKGGLPIVAGVLGGAIARKLPVIKSIPRQIPVIGKYIRW